MKPFVSVGTFALIVLAAALLAGPPASAAAVTGSTGAVSGSLGYVQPAGTTVSFTSSPPANVVVGSPGYTPTAESSSGQPVSFAIDSATTNAACSLSSGVVAFMNAGSCVIDAYVSGDGGPAAQAQQTIAVGVATTATVLTAGQGTLTATVTVQAPGGGTPAGVVIFSVEGRTIGSAGLAGGSASLSYTPPANTTETLTASYQGEADYSPSAGSLTVSGPTVEVPFAVAPTIRAHLSSTGRRNAYGWWHTPVRVVFRCLSPSARIRGGCPRPLTLRWSGRDLTVRRTITNLYGVSATVIVRHIRIDLTRPRIRWVGAREQARYHGRPPRVRCVATDRVSGIERCRVSRRVMRHGGLETVEYRATARSWAGTTKTAWLTVYIVH